MGLIMKILKQKWLLEGFYTFFYLLPKKKSFEAIPVAQFRKTRSWLEQTSVTEGLRNSMNFWKRNTHHDLTWNYYLSKPVPPPTPSHFFFKFLGITFQVSIGPDGAQMWTYFEKSNLKLLINVRKNYEFKCRNCLYNLHVPTMNVIGVLRGCPWGLNHKIDIEHHFYLYDKSPSFG